MLTVSASLATPALPAALKGNGIADDWAQAHAGRTPAGAAANDVHAIYRSTWPTRETLAMLRQRELDPLRAWEGCLDSTLALHAGLSVVEVFAAREPEHVFILQLDR